MAEKSLSDAKLVAPEEIARAAARLPEAASRTPVMHLEGCTLKLENLQPTGSFKIRGAFTKLSRLSTTEREQGVVAYSSGNHGLAVAYAACLFSTPATIVVPSDATPTKLLAISRAGAELVQCPPSSEERRLLAEKIAESSGKRLIPPYDDPDIIAGQGTVGLEIAEEIDDLSTVVVPVGGGGLISGVAAAIKATRPEVRVVGVEPALAADARDSLLGRRLVSWKAEEVGRTSADGVRTQSLGQLTFEHIVRLVDEIVVVSEEDILDSLLFLLERHIVAEPAGALSLAAVRAGVGTGTGTVAVISGGNIGVSLLESLVTRLRDGQEKALRQVPISIQQGGSDGGGWQWEDDRARGVIER